jgi:hypothetical protein
MAIAPQLCLIGGSTQQRGEKGSAALARSGRGKSHQCGYYFSLHFDPESQFCGSGKVDIISGKNWKKEGEKRKTKIRIIELVVQQHEEDLEVRLMKDTE